MDEKRVKGGGTSTSERVYLALVHRRGWSSERYERWLKEQLTAALLQD